MKHLNKSKFFSTVFGAILSHVCPVFAVTNTSGQFSSDIENYIQDEVLALSYRTLVAYQFGDPLKLPENRGTTYTASRYVRLNLPYAPLQEGIAPPGEQMSLQQVSVTAQQWGDKVTVTDVANLTIKHPIFQMAVELVSLQVNETLERNTFNALMAGTNINYANGKTSRAALTAGDVMSPHESNAVFGIFGTYGVPAFNGSELKDVFKDVEEFRPVKDSAGMQHYVAIPHPLVSQDMRENAVVSNAWSYSDVDKLYNNELGDWGGFRWCSSNMVPYWTGVAQVNGSGSTSGGTLATGTYYIQITGAPAQTSVEQQIYQVSNSISITGPTGSISFTTPNLSGYVFNAYIGTTTSPSNLAASPQGPATGSQAGMAVQLPPNTLITLTATGSAQTPPAAPATGVTVYPTFFIGKHAYGQVSLQEPEFFYLTGADKSDPLNQTRVVSWKVFYGTILLNQNFFMRVESTSAFSPNPSSGAFSIVN